MYTNKSKPIRFPYLSLLPLSLIDLGYDEIDGLLKCGARPVFAITHPVLQSLHWRAPALIADQEKIVQLWIHAMQIRSTKLNIASLLVYTEIWRCV